MIFSKRIFSKRNLIPVFVILVLMGVFYAFSLLYKVRLHEQTDVRFNTKLATESDRTVSNIQQAGESIGVLLYASRAFFNSSEEITRDEWRNYVESLDLEKEVVPISALEFIKRIPLDEKDDYVASVQDEEDDRFGEYAITPEGDREEYYVIHFAEPYESNKDVLGYDLLSNPERKFALELARDGNSIVVTEPIALVEADTYKKAILAIMPIYDQEADLSTLDSRREHVLGFVIVVIKADDLFSSIAKISQMSEFDGFSVRDVTNRSQMLLPFVDYQGHVLDVSDMDEFSTTQTSLVNIGKRIWEVEFKTNQTADTASGLEAYTPDLILVFGSLVALSIGGVLFNQLRLRQRAEKLAKELTRDLAKFKLAVDTVNEHIVITDPDGIVLYANDAVRTITGFSNAEVMGTKAGVLWGKLMGQSFYEEFWKRIKTEKKSFSGLLKNRRKNGVEYDAYATVTPVMDEHDEVLYFVGIERDVTKEKEVERMKTEFLSVAAHQLRTPLGTMRWNTEIILEGTFGKLSKSLQEAIQVNYDNNLRLLTLVNDLLDVSRIDQGRVSDNPVKTDVVALVKETVTELQKTADQKEINISFKKDGTFPQITIDKNRLKEVVENLVGNAVKYSSSKGTVSVSMKVGERTFSLEVEDTGMGITTVDQQKIFSKFFRANNAQVSEIQGSGLGLYVVKTYVQSWGGEISFKSDEGKGTTFYVTIPLKPKSHLLDKNLADKPHTSK